MQRVTLQAIYVLHSRPYSNTSLILDCLTHQHGRLSLMARSARGTKSRYKGKLQLFSPLLASWTGNRELKNLGTVEHRGAIHSFDGQTLACGFYVNELLQRLLQREDPQPDIFRLYEKTMGRLQSNPDPRIALRCFEKNLLQSLGYGLSLSHEAQSQQSFNEQAFYQYIPEQGFLPVEKHEHNHFIFQGKTLIDLSQECFEDDNSLHESKRLLRLALSRHLGSKPIKSRELLR